MYTLSSKFIACLLLTPLIIFNLVSNGNANSAVTVQGAAPITSSESAARDEALRNAMRAAVEKGIGTLLESKTRVENFQVISDKIYSQSSGYIKDYKVLD